MKDHGRRGFVTLSILAVAGLALVSALSSSRAAQEDKRSRSDFMRQKLEFSKNVLEGLSLENYPMIEKNAKSLKRLSQAAEWEVPTIPNATDYVALTSEFQRYADDLIQPCQAEQHRRGDPCVRQAHHELRSMSQVRPLRQPIEDEVREQSSRSLTSRCRD